MRKSFNRGKNIHKTRVISLFTKLYEGVIHIKKFKVKMNEEKGIISNKIQEKDSIFWNIKITDHNFYFYFSSFYLGKWEVKNFRIKN